MNSIKSHTELLDEEVPYVGRILSDFMDLDDCILIEANLLDFGNIFELLLECNNMTHLKGMAHGEYAKIRLLRFVNVQEISYKTATFDNFNLPRAKWEAGELSHIKLENDPRYLARFGPLAILFNHVEIEWKNKRVMDVVFSGLELV